MVGVGVGAGIGAYAVSLAARAAHGIYFLRYPKHRTRGPKGWSGWDDDWYRAP